MKVADTWEKNPHARTVHPAREAGDGVHVAAVLVLGARIPQRGLRQDGYGEFDLLAAGGKTWAVSVSTATTGTALSK